MNAAAYLLFREGGKPAFHQINPGGAGGREMDVKARPLTQPVADKSARRHLSATSGIATRVGSTGVGEVGDLYGNPIPEPSAMLLLSIGLAGLGAAALRRRKTRRPW
jgi:hypothetical protein